MWEAVGFGYGVFLGCVRGTVLSANVLEVDAVRCFVVAGVPSGPLGSAEIVCLCIRMESQTIEWEERLYGDF